METVVVQRRYAVKRYLCIPVKKLHSADHMPAITIKENDGHRHIWMNMGIIHRDVEPAIILSSGDFIIRHWLRHGKYFRENNLPNYSMTYKGELVCEKYLVGTYKKYRVYNPSGGPSVLYYRYWQNEITCFTNGNISVISRSEIEKLAKATDQCKPIVSFTFEGNFEIVCKIHNKECQSVVHPIVSERCQMWTNPDGFLHSQNDKPAIIYSDGTEFWFNNGHLHRVNEPSARIILQGKPIVIYAENGIYSRVGSAPILVDNLHNFKIYRHGPTYYAEHI